MEDFHEDIQSKILSHVPSESLMNCKLVCKRWRQLLSNRKVSLGILFAISSYPDYKIQLHYADYDVIKSSKPVGEEEEEAFYYKTKISKINLPPTEVISRGYRFLVGSCNGLVCVAVPHGRAYNPIYICNPFTSEYTYLPSENMGKWYIVSGFGYLPSTNEYKVVRILYSTPSSTKGQVEVYTLGKGTTGSDWRKITTIKYSLDRDSKGVYANQSLYWQGKNNKEIVAFDLADENFRLLPTPPQGISFSCISVLGGHLCVVYQPCDSDTLDDIWSFRKNKHWMNKNSSDVIEQDYYKDWSWSKVYSVEWERNKYKLCLPFALTKSNEVLIWSKHALKCYNLITKSVNNMLNGNLYIDMYRGILHMNSLVSLKDFGAT